MANYTIEGTITAISCNTKTLEPFLVRIKSGLGLVAFLKCLVLVVWMM